MRPLILALSVLVLGALPARASLVSPLDLSAGQRTFTFGPLSVLPEVRYDHALSDRLSVGVSGVAVFFGYSGFLLGANASYVLGQTPGGMSYGLSMIGGALWLPVASTFGFQGTPAGAYPWAYPALSASVPLGRPGAPLTFRASLGPMIMVDASGTPNIVLLPLPELGIRTGKHSELVLLGGFSLLSWRSRF